MFHLCIANRDNLAIVFGLLACYITPQFRLRQCMVSRILCARVHRRTGIVTYAASCCDLPITQAEHTYDKNLNQVPQTALLSIFTNISVPYNAHATRPALRLLDNVARAAHRGGKQGGTEVHTELHRTTLLPNYLNDNN